MPTLNWIGKDKVMTHHLDVPCHVLDHKYGFRASNPSDKTPTDSGNLIIHGDNLLALKALLPQYEGRVKCIYIDPPYNTGNEKWVYNDNVNDPRIRKWLGEVVGVEGEDLSRHDKWLCMMYPRLQLLRQLLSEDGVIFISIDDNELANIKLICNEVFGSSNFIGQWMWYKSATPPNLSYKIKKNLEYIICYEKHKTDKKYAGIQKFSKSDDPIIKPQNATKVLTFPIGSIHCKCPDGIYEMGTYGTKQYPNILLNDMEVSCGRNANQVSFKNRFIWTQEKLSNELLNKTIISCSKSLVLSYKKSSYDPEVPPNLIDSSVGVNTTEEAGRLLTNIFGYKVFNFPKDPSLIEYLINFQRDPNAIILDSFAGSGTTAHAVMELNKKDGGNRRFILIELMDYADSITAERVKRVAQGYGTGNKHVEGLGGEFDFYELGASIFNEDGNLNEDIGKQRIREYIYYSETRQALTRAYNDGEYLLDTVNNVSYYLYYEKDALCALTHDTLNIITQKSESYIVYADTCSISKDWLTEHNITFKQIPRDIRRF